MGRTEVTAAQYTEFLNSVAANDVYGLYSTAMETAPQVAGIARSGVPGNYSYTVMGTEGNFPISFVDWGDAARFANWLHNGQPVGAQDDSSTEAGAYSLQGAVTDAALLAVTRNAIATWVIPNESEWYKAAYYQPAAAGGDADGYWLYPTASNSEPNSDQPPGEPVIEANAANFFRTEFPTFGYNEGYAITGESSSQFDKNYLSNVGAYTQSPGYYGTFDQAGNVSEWNEGLRFNGTSRGIRGGSWFDRSTLLQSQIPFHGPATGRSPLTGFRVALIPEPGLFALIGWILAMPVIRLRSK
jgi:formylglycine-generating enzyme required for sulfatase activity